MNRPAAGRPAPLGATVLDGGVNFSLGSRTATGVELLFFDHEDAPAPVRSLTLDPVANRTYHYWHCFVPGIGAGQLYGYRVHGPEHPDVGLRFNPAKVLLDPYGRGVAMPAGYSPAHARGPGDNAASALKSVVVDPSAYDWEGDVPLRQPSARTVIYELHVRGFTRHPSSGLKPEIRGTYQGLAEKVGYLKDLGVTAVELLPVHCFDPFACPQGLVNYWGYQTVSYFAPHPLYSSRRTPLGPVNEFRDMVKALHRAGIEVILDVVYNHTAEGNQEGPALSFRGIDNTSYYILEPGGEYYSNYTGCGNTLNANHPGVRRLIVDSLRYWVTEMHVDGFRFDLASILSRDTNGYPLPNPPVLWDIESDPALAGTKLIAEAWDAAGLYQVGSFVGDAWKEWNGKFRDDARDFFRSEPGAVGRFADRMLGSHDIYGHKEREAEQSVNFVTCHDGFTLNDLVSYNGKHNDANREDNRDGESNNRSWNCGAEGPTADPAIEALRNRQVKNFLTATMMSLGVPMIVMGDEVRRSQGGNNNAYCHDAEWNWFDWALVEKHADVHRFVKLLLSRRVTRDVTHEQERLSLSELLAGAHKAWHGVKLNQPDWGGGSHSIAFCAELQRENLAFHIILSAYWEPLEFELPVRSGPWRRWIDTSLPSPEDIVEWSAAPAVHGDRYRVGPRSVVLLVTDLPSAK
jgi:glycogen operon protein